jgi:hypothetical protein
MGYFEIHLGVLYVLLELCDLLDLFKLKFVGIVHRETCCSSQCSSESGVILSSSQPLICWYCSNYGMWLHGSFILAFTMLRAYTIWYGYQLLCLLLLSWWNASCFCSSFSLEYADMAVIYLVKWLILVVICSFHWFLQIWSLDIFVVKPKHDCQPSYNV